MRSECLNSSCTPASQNRCQSLSMRRVDRSTWVVKSPKTISHPRDQHDEKSEKLRVNAAREWHVTCTLGISQALAEKSTRTLTHRTIALYRIRISA
jgi:hypothetical protein